MINYDFDKFTQSQKRTSFFYEKRDSETFMDK